MKKSRIVLFLLFCFTACAQAQLVPGKAIKAMARGINLGNTFDAPSETAWGNPAVVASNFDDYKNAGFTCVRVPITWDTHTATSVPYTIDPTWFNRIEQIIDWGLSRHLLIIINAHHEAWIKGAYTSANTARFDSIWSQIATRFKNKSDSLMFEIINEPNGLTLANVNDLNARTIATIRKTNPTRIVLFSGNVYANSAELMSAAVPQDNYLIGYFHSYDPYPFGLLGTGTYGSDADIATTKNKFDQVAAWSATKNNLPVVISEFGATKTCEYNSRMCLYATVVEQALTHTIAFNVWEDGGDFKFYNRTEHTWSEIKDILIHTYKESPNKMKISAYADTSIQIQWNNRTAENDSIIVERKVDSGNFTFLAKVFPLVTSFIDSTTSKGKTYYYRLRANLKDSIELQSYPVMLRILATRAPFSGTPASIPGTIEAENYDIGGEGLTSHDSDNINEGKDVNGKTTTYRPNDGVDIEELPAGNIHIGYTAAGEWLEYTVHVQKSGSYPITASVASGVTTNGVFSLKFGNGAPCIFTTAPTGSWSTYTNVTSTVTLQAGEQIMRFTVLNAGFNLDKITFSPATSVASENTPVQFQLLDNYPNPFNPATTFAFSLPSRTFVSLKIFDVMGREVATVISELMNEGAHTRYWSAQGVSSGVYYYRIQAGYFSETKKLVILK